MCNCADEVDAKLAQFNTRLVRPIMLSGPQEFYPLIETEQVEKGRGKRKACSMFATYCPFCGEKIEQTNG